MRGSGNRSVEKSQWITEKLCLAERLFLLLSSYPSPSSWLVQVGCAAAGTGTPTSPVPDTRTGNWDRPVHPTLQPGEREGSFTPALFPLALSWAREGQERLPPALCLGASTCRASPNTWGRALTPRCSFSLGTAMQVGVCVTTPARSDSAP